VSLKTDASPAIRSPTSPQKVERTRTNTVIAKFRNAKNGEIHLSNPLAYRAMRRKTRVFQQPGSTTANELINSSRFDLYFHQTQGAPYSNLTGSVCFMNSGKLSIVGECMLHGDCQRSHPVRFRQTVANS
jgi:hypothetical protein